MSDPGTSFLFLCRKMYFDGYTPSNKNLHPSENYQMLCNLAQQLIAKRGNEGFALYFCESQYLVDLWAAHFILEYGRPSEIMKTRALYVVNKYAQMSIKIKLAQEEKAWLKENGYV